MGVRLCVRVRVRVCLVTDVSFVFQLLTRLREDDFVLVDRPR